MDQTGAGHAAEGAALHERPATRDALLDLAERAACDVERRDGVIGMIGQCEQIEDRLPAWKIREIQLVETSSVLDTYLREGKSIIDFEAYQHYNGETRFAGVWVNDPNQPPTHLLYNLEALDISRLLNPMQGRIKFKKYWFGAIWKRSRQGTALDIASIQN